MLRGKTVILYSSMFIGILVFVGRGIAGGLGSALSEYLPGPDVDDGWSLFVGGDFESTTNSVALEGRGFIRGDFQINGINYFEVNNKSAPRGSGVYPSINVPHLVVGGDIYGSSGLDMFSNPLQVGGSIDGGLGLRRMGDVIQGGIDMAAMDAILLESQLRSQMLAALPPTPGGTVAVQGSGLYITAVERTSSPQVWVFELDIDVTKNFWGISMDGFEEGDTILINCVKSNGSSNFVLECNSFGINGNDDSSPLAANLLWNFPDVERIRIGGGTFQGSALIGNPDSVTELASSNMQGRFITCGSLRHGTGGNGEGIYNYPFTGDLPVLPCPSLGSISGSIMTGLKGSNGGEGGGPLQVPLAGMRVKLYHAPDEGEEPDEGDLVQEVLSDSSGYYHFGGLSGGDYMVVVVSSRSDASDLQMMATCTGVNNDNDFLIEIEPMGFLYDTADGSVVAGGSIEVIGDGVVVQLDGTSGEYAFFTTNQSATVFTLVITPPVGYQVDPDRTAMAGSYSTSGHGAAIVMGSGLVTNGVHELEDYSEIANPYYLSFEMTPGDQEVLYNNIPLAKNDGLSADVSVKAYALKRGGAVLKLGTIDESGGSDIVIQAWLDGSWVEVGRVPASEVVGEGSNNYTVFAPLLQHDRDYKLRIQDESGQDHEKFAYVTVKSVRVKELRRSSEVFELTFDSEYGIKYRIYGSNSLLGGEVSWQPCQLFFPRANGWSALTDTAFYAGPGQSTTVRIPASRGAIGFYKVVLVDD